MKKVRKKSFCIAACLIAAFTAWTVLVRTVDVQPIGAENTDVGFATLNGFVHKITGINMLLYTVTDWLGLVPIATAAVFATIGLTQWIKRKSPLRVDRSILALGVFYIAVIAVYVLFEIVVVNYRPVLIDGNLEASYPSSTTVLVTCVMPTAVMQLNTRIKNVILKRYTSAVIVAFTAFMVVGRLFSGVHWITDIIGGAIFSAGAVMMYYSLGFCE